MKKTLLAMVAAAACLSASAEIYYPYSFAPNFAADYDEATRMPEGWTSFGVDATVDASYQNQFPRYSATNAASLLSFGSGTYAIFTPSQLTKGGQSVTSDQWVISPEFEITDDTAMLAFTVCVYGNKSSNKYKILLSEGGAEKEDFTTELLSASLLGGGETSINTGQRRIVLEGMKGKKVRMAFVNTGNTTGIMGIANVVCGSYFIEVSNASYLQDLMATNNTPTIPVDLRISTPVTSKGLTATITADNGWTSTATSSVSISKSKVSTVGLHFPDPMQMGDASEVNFTIEVQPNVEGMPPTIIKGKATNAPRPYDQVAVVEEITGSWCGWCPRGIAFMNYYQDLYNTEGNHRVIPIMVHGSDVMMDYDYAYESIQTIQNLSGNAGYPMVAVNRTYAGDPGEAPIPTFLEGKAYAKTGILGVAYDFDKGGEVTVRCGSELSYDVANGGLSLAVALIENNVKGYNTEYDQADYYGPYGIAAIVQAYGQELAPYFELFVDRPAQKIPFTEMVYQEVARGIFPSYQGSKLEGAWKVGEQHVDHVSFNMPQSVLNTRNCAVVAMLIKDSTGEIVSGDILDASKWVPELAGVGETAVASANMTARAAAEGLEVALMQPAEVGVFSIDGTMLYHGSLEVGCHVLPVAKGQAVIVRAVSASGNSVAKVVL